MLELHDQELGRPEGAELLRCDVNLPASWEEGRHERGKLPGQYVDRRRYPRYHFRVCAALHYRQTFPTFPRSEVRHKIFTNDLSRNGISFFHSEPLFPRERMQIVLPRHSTRTIEVVWCIRLQERCFHVGARFVEQSAALDPCETNRKTEIAAPGASDAPEPESRAG